MNNLSQGVPLFYSRVTVLDWVTITHWTEMKTFHFSFISYYWLYRNQAQSKHNISYYLAQRVFNYYYYFIIHYIEQLILLYGRIWNVDDQNEIWVCKFQNKSRHIKYVYTYKHRKKQNTKSVVYLTTCI